MSQSKDHKNTTTATKTIDPAAMPAAYQRMFPISVRLSARHAISFTMATAGT